ncbi:PREDICTED: melanopsin-A-like [Priapulus caudatus]|uniref:Melanopsin-A-like n=1 Tax=Priapulus caudatus TaxID=37621 RepID=A0ABM1F5Z8_PRICU|nr:PREDICTED: melanopsin-A-like [Priapulus caudatus]
MDYFSNTSNITDNVISRQRVDHMVASIMVPIMCILAVGVAVTNVATIVAFKRTDLREAPHYLAVNMAVSDIGLGMYPFYLAPAILGDMPKPCCIFILFVMNFFGKISYTNLLLITVDRYLAVTRPMHYYQMVTVARIKVLLVFTWLWGLALSNAVLVGERWFPESGCSYELVVGKGAIYFGTAHISADMVIMFAVYSRLAVIAYGHWKVEPTVAGGSALTKHLKLTKVFLVVVVSFVVCWSPFYILTLLEITDNYADSVGIVRYTLYCLPLVNLLSNPLIYAWKIPAFSKVFKAIFMCKYVSAERQVTDGDHRSAISNTSNQLRAK